MCRSRVWHPTEQVINLPAGMSRVLINQHNGDRLFQHHHVHFVIKLCFQRKKSLELGKNTINYVSNAVSLSSLIVLFLFLSSILATCSTLLNSGNLNEHDKKIYCVGCYRRQFGPHGGKHSLMVFRLQ